MVCVGIDIGTYSVKLVELQSSTKTYSLSRFQEFLLSADPNKDKKIEVLDILRQIAQAYDPITTKFILVVPQQHVVLRHRHFPFKERYKILRSIAFDLEDDIPLAQEDSIFDAKITRILDTGAEVIASACPKIYLKEVVHLAREAGIEAEIVSIEGLALGNLLENWMEPPQIKSVLEGIPEPRNAELILNIGHTRTQLVAAADKALLTARNIDWGGKQVAEAIANKYGLHYLEALKDLQKKSFILPSSEGATKDQVIFSDLIKQAFEPMIQEVRFSIIELMANNNLLFSKIHLCGGTSQIKGLGPFLTQKLDIAVNRFRHVSIHPQSVLGEGTYEEAISATAIGVSLEGLKRPRHPASNLLKEEFARQAESLKLWWEKWRYTVQLSGTAFLILFIYSVIKDDLAISMNEKVLEVLKTQAATIADLKGNQASPNNIRKFVKIKKEEISARKVANQVKSLNSPLDVLAFINQVSPGPKKMVVEIRKVNIENDQLELFGEVSRTEYLNQFQQVLQNVAMDGKVTPLSSPSHPDPSKRNFGFRLKIDRHRGG